MKYIIIALLFISYTIKSDAHSLNDKKIGHMKMHYLYNLTKCALPDTTDLLKISKHPSKPANFTGRIEGKQYLGDSIRVVFIRDFIANGTISEYKETNSFRFYIRPDKYGNFSFQIPNLNHPGRLDLLLVKGNFEYQLNNNYLVEPGDSIYINIKKDRDTISVVHSGIGSEKYTCSDLLQTFQNEKFISQYYPSVDSVKDYEALSKSFQRYIEDANLLLTQHTAHMTPMAIDYLKAEITAYPSGIWALVGRLLYNDPGSSVADKNNISQVYKTFPILDQSSFRNETLFLSQKCIRALLEKIITDYTIRVGHLPTLEDTYFETKKKYSGSLRDKLLSSVLLNRSIKLSRTEEKYARCLLDATKTVKVPYINSYLSAQLVLGAGRDAYPFELPDVNGKRVKLSDFKGKVLLLDFWFTGCTGCAQFFQSFKDSIYPQIKDESAFKIVSVNTDLKRETWLKSLKIGKYTNEHHINVYTEGLGFSNHPMLNYYKVSSAPFILLIDKKGKIISNISSYWSNTQKISELINNAVKM